MFGKMNLNSVERWIRIALGVRTLYKAADRGQPMGLLGLYPLATGLVGRDPAYGALGVSSEALPAMAADNPITNAVSLTFRGLACGAGRLKDALAGTGAADTIKRGAKGISSVLMNRVGQLEELLGEANQLRERLQQERKPKKAARKPARAKAAKAEQAETAEKTERKRPAARSKVAKEAAKPAPRKRAASKAAAPAVQPELQIQFMPADHLMEELNLENRHDPITMEPDAAVRDFEQEPEATYEPQGTLQAERSYEDGRSS